ncbi:MAG: primosomal protein N' [Spirochaetia bacterium]
MERSSSAERTVLVMPLYAEIVFRLPLDKSFTYLSEETITIGDRVLAPFRGRKLHGFVISVTNEKPNVGFSLHKIIRKASPVPLFDQEYLVFAKWISTRYLCSLGEALSTMLPGGKRETEIQGIQDAISGSHSFELADQQIQAIDTIFNSEGTSSYLHGITGSGKTEVYIRAAKKVIHEQKQPVIFLVPEIALAQQTIHTLANRFECGIAILHSGLTPSQRLKEWVRILKGEVMLVVGVRSAVFAPLKNIGMVIIDEEHETSYKSSTTPRYHARQVAQYRLSKTGGRLLMGSATPSVEAYYHFQNGNFQNIQMPLRLGGGKLPEVRTVPMPRGNEIFSAELIEEIEKTYEEGKQTVLFLNRRGFSHYYHCKSCGYEMVCKNCSVSMTFHKQKNRMICHYCGTSAPPLYECPECGSLDVWFTGFGTERVEEHIKAKFPGMTLKRIDTDTAKNKKELEKTIKEFRDHKIDILLGTQMVAKGLNFPKVRLVGIVNADMGLHIPDFRAEERIFSLIVQVSGRAGRQSGDGLVIVQTNNPQNPAIDFSVKGELERFYNKELSTRKALQFPPYSRLIRLVFRGKDKQETADNCFSAAQLLEKELQGKAGILGPAECPIGLLNRNYRYHILIKSNSFRTAHTCVTAFMEHFQENKNVYIEVDMDPISLL